MKAFPTDRLGVIANTRDISINQTQQDGMDLRDYFAAKVMHYWLTYPMTSIHIENMCKGAYHIADEMMKAREQK